ncbi:MAG: HAMP domain-containing histidine kinase [Agarilytica sp.]
MKKRSLEVIIPITSNEKLSSLVCIGEPKTSLFFKNEDVVIFTWLQTELGNAITRIENINKMKNELNESRKTLSMLNVMNQYHHDIKTPLAVIDGIVSTGMYDKAQQREIVMEQVAKGTKLIATMANILRGKRNREITQIMLRDCIQQCLLLFDNKFENTSQDFSDTIYILGDDIDLKILFSNLLKNASEAADPKRALTLSVKTWEDQQYVYISITDSGTGMNTETVNNLWHLEKSEKETGSAIGLQAVKRIAEEHDAHISVTSTPGFGTCFELRFPISKE